MDIIQIALNEDSFYALTNQEKVYERIYKSEKTGEDEWTDTWSWEEVPPVKTRVRNTKGEINF